MSDSGEVVQVNAVQFRRLLPGAPGRVWQHLTEARRLTGWYGDDGRIEPREGGAVWLMGGHVRGVVTRWRPQRSLAYTWNVFDPGEDESRFPESYLSFELEPRDGQTALRLFHLPVPDAMEPQTRMGWHTFLDMLEDGVADRPVRRREGCMARNAERYGVDLS